LRKRHELESNSSGYGIGFDKHARSRAKRRKYSRRKLEVRRTGGYLAELSQGWWDGYADAKGTSSLSDASSPSPDVRTTRAVPERLGAGAGSINERTTTVVEGRTLPGVVVGAVY
jgi:hypothetical protein